MKQTITLLFLFVLIGCGSNSTYKSETKNKDWAMLNFVKVDSLNPILEPQLNQVFQSPISNKQVHWEEMFLIHQRLSKTEKYISSIEHRTKT